MPPAGPSAPLAPSAPSAKPARKHRRATKTRAARPPKLHAARPPKPSAANAANKPDPDKTKNSDARAKRTSGARAKQTGGGRDEETTVVIVGAGRLGSALALALDAAGGYRITALVSRRRARALRAARLLRPGALALAADELEKIPASDLLIIATPDDQIAPTAARLAAALGSDAALRSVVALGPAAAAAPGSSESPAITSRPARPSKTTRGARVPVALHASGALSSEALAPLRARGFRLGSLHPLVSVSDAASAARGFGGAYFCVEGEPSAARAARRIVRALGGHAFSVRAEDKALYHAAAVLAAGHAVALFDLATRTLAACGLTTREARRVLLPLARSNLANLAAATTNARALTGPFARADVETVRRHLAAFAARDLEAARALYSLLGLASLGLAAEAGADASALAEIERALSGR